MPLWIPITVTAALFQCWRTAMQQKLRGLLSVNGAAFIRFMYGAPVAIVYLLAALLVTRTPFPGLSPHLLAFAAAGGLTQIIGTNLLIMAFGFRNFAVGSAYAKTEAMQTGLVALVVLHEQLHPLAWAGIGVGLAGVLTLSLAGRGMRPGQILAATVQPAALCGLGAGFFLGTTGVLVKIATHHVPIGTFPVPAPDSSTGPGPFSATSRTLPLTINAPTIPYPPARPAAGALGGA